MAALTKILAPLIVAAIACTNDAMPSAPSSSGAQSTPPVPIRVLMITTTAGFRHDAIPAARHAMDRLAASGEIRVTATEDLATIADDALAGYDVLFFALTTGELPLAADQKSAMLAFVSGGKGFMGVHSATDTLYAWPEYGALIGAYFKEHPWTQEAGVIVEDRAHQATNGLGERFTLLDEFYTFRDNPRPRVQVLLRLDAGSVGATGDYPLAWTSTYGSGRVYYNALGHFPATWQDARFERQIIGALRWLARR